MVGNKGSRVDIINNLLSIDKSSFLPTELLQEKAVLDWYSLYTTYSKHPNSWTIAIVANALCGFDVILTRSA